MADDQVLTNAEEAQLNRILGTIGQNTAALGIMENELPNTLLLNTVAQTVTGGWQGEKYFYFSGS